MMKNNLIIKAMVSPPKDTNVYLLVNKTEAALVDAGDCVDTVQETLKDLRATLKYILITHGHPSHISALSQIKSELGGTICLHASELDLLRQQESGLDADLLLKDGQSLKLGNATIRVLHTPGHTMGSLCYHLPEAGILFTGDTLNGSSTTPHSRRMRPRT